MDFFDVYVLRFDVNEERATRALMQVFGLSEAAARIFVHSVPRVGKRNVPTDTAERYVRALHAVGAVVECRRSGSAPLGENANKVQPMSLPAPTSSNYPGSSDPPHIMQDSLGIMGPLAYSPDMPQIPKAPRIPADLHAIRARKGPDSLAPNWRSATDQSLISSSAKGLRGSSPKPRGGGGGGGGGDVGGGGASFDGGGGGGAVASAGGALWDSRALQISSDPLAERKSPFNRRASPEPVAAQEQDRTDRVDHAGLEGVLSSPAPLSPSPFAPSIPRARADEPTPWFANATHQLLLACLIIGGMVLAMSSGVFETDAARRGRAFQDAGVRAGEYEAAATFLARPDNTFQGIAPEELKALLDGLSRAGAKSVWVANIVKQGQRRSSHTLLVELPDEAAARASIFKQQIPNSHVRRPTPEDSGQRILTLVF
jgi:hypothetical protein